MRDRQLSFIKKALEQKRSQLDKAKRENNEPLIKSIRNEIYQLTKDKEMLVVAKQEEASAKKHDRKEKLILVLMMSGVFLPVRLFFYSFVSKHWIGSLGIVTAIAVFIIYFSHKNKLGYLGRLWQRQIKKISTGKLGKFLLAESIFAVIVYSGYGYFIEAGDAYYSEEKQVILDFMEERGLDNYKFDPNSKDFQTASNNVMNAYKDIVTKPEVRQEFIEHYAVWENLHHDLSLSTSLINDFSHGWLRHFDIVFLVENLEQLGIIIYFRYIYKPKLKTEKPPQTSFDDKEYLS